MKLKKNYKPKLKVLFKIKNQTVLLKTNKKNVVFKKYHVIIILSLPKGHHFKKKNAHSWWRSVKFLFEIPTLHLFLFTPMILKFKKKKFLTSFYAQDCPSLQVVPYIKKTPLNQNS